MGAERQLDMIRERAEQDEFAVSWADLLMTVQLAVKRIGRERVAKARGLSEGRLLNILGGHAGNVLHAELLVWIAREDLDLARELAGLFGLVVQAEPAPPSEIEILEAAVIEEHGPAGMRTVVRERKAREQRVRAARLSSRK